MLLLFADRLQWYFVIPHALLRQIGIESVSMKCHGQDVLVCGWGQDMTNTVDGIPRKPHFYIFLFCVSMSGSGAMCFRYRFGQL